MMDSAIMDKPKPSKRRGRWTGPTAYSLIRDHLEGHGSITLDEAKKLYNISKGSFHSTIGDLKMDGWAIGTSRYRNDAGQLRSKYHLADEDGPAQEVVTSTLPAIAEDGSTVMPGGKTTAAPPPSKKAHTVAVRIGEKGLEVQLASSTDTYTARFFLLTPKQIEYLALNFKLYQALSDAKKGT